jgi:RNA polymerase sigma-70 factor (ECF subfamily)
MDWPAGPASEWVEAMRAAGPAVQGARERLHKLLLQTARAEVDRRGSAASVLAAGPDRRTAPAAASVALAAMTHNLDSYRGEPSFAAWAVKFVIAAVTEEAGRWYWQRTIRPAGRPEWDDLRPGLGNGPDVLDASRVLDTLRRAVEEDLTASQRLVFTAVVLGELPPEALTSGLGPDRNAIYQALYQARRIVGARLAATCGQNAVSSSPRRPGGAGSLDEALAADPGDAGCDVAFLALERYAAVNRATRLRRFPGVAAHLRGCKPCMLDYEGLLAAVPHS